MTISVILPTCNRYDVLLKNIENIRQQDVKVEILVGDDSDVSYLKENRDKMEEIQEKADQYFLTAIYDHERNKLYGLGRARNTCVIYAHGQFLVFLDDRITPAIPNMISMFVDELKKSEDKIWVFGNKGANKASFVENCSAIRRDHLIVGGMFPETINQYGYMTRETHHRFVRQGFQFKYMPEALAEPLCKGSSRTKEREAHIRECREILGKMYR